MQVSCGIATFLFTDIEGSSRLWEEDPERMKFALARHDAICRAVVGSHHGLIVKTTGDGVYAAFDDAFDAVTAALTLQETLANPEATHGLPLSLRCGLHLGVAERRDNDFFGAPLNRAARIMAAAHGGQTLLSQAVASVIADRLRDGVTLRDLGTVRLRDLSSPEHVYQIVHPKLRADFPALRSLERTPNNLPQQMTSFIGRKRERVEVAALLSKSRLVTLEGTGGMGKTRLSLQVAADSLDSFPDGVWLVELATLNDSRLVPRTVASLLGVSEKADQPLVETLAEAIGDRRSLIVLDNCEHLISACAEMAYTFLRRTNGVRIIATSREALRVDGEQIYRVGSLSMPARGDSLEEILRSDAAQLLVDRVSLQLSGWTPSAPQTRAIADICKRLDGLPLALELAAARMATIPVEHLASRLDQRFRLLVGGPRTALPRQQTLRALIDWSYELLSGTEQILFRRLSVFRGGWTLDAATAVMSGAIAGDEVQELLDGLVRKSLISIELDAARYQMLETILEYAAERLYEDPAQSRAISLHLKYFSDLIEAAGPALRGGREQAAWHVRLEADHENIRVSLDRAIEDDQTVDTAAAMCAILYRFWAECGHNVEGFDRCTSVLTRGRSVLGADRLAKLMLATGSLALGVLGEDAHAEALLREALTLAQAAHAADTEAAALHNLAMSLVIRGDSSSVPPELIQRARAINRVRGNRAWELNNLIWLGRYHAERGEHEDALLFWNEARPLSRSLGYRLRESLIARHLGLMALLRGDMQGARCLLEEALSLCEGLGSPSHLADVLTAAAQVATASGRYAEAAKYCLRALRLPEWREIAWGTKAGPASALEELAVLATINAEAVVGARLWGAADQARKAKRYSWSESERLPVFRAQCRAVLPSETWDAAYDTGRSMSIEQATTAACEFADRLVARGNQTPGI